MNRPSLLDTLLLIILSLGTALLLAIAVLLVPGSARAEDKPYTVIRPEQLQWGASGSLPNGSETIVLLGNPAKAGPFVLRLKLPAGTKSPTGNFLSRWNRL